MYTRYCIKWSHHFTRGFYVKPHGVKCCRYVHNDSHGVKFSLYAQRHEWRKIFPLCTKAIFAILRQSMYDPEFANAEFANAEFANAEFANAEFANAEFANAEFANAEFGNAEFARTQSSRTQSSRTQSSRTQSSGTQSQTDWNTI